MHFRVQRVAKRASKTTTMNPAPSPVRLSAGVWIVNGASYDGYGGAGKKSKHQRYQHQELTHRAPVVLLGTVKVAASMPERVSFGAGCAPKNELL